jgi:hypothetical protein
VVVMLKESSAAVHQFKASVQQEDGGWTANAINTLLYFMLLLPALLVLLLLQVCRTC